MLGKYIIPNIFYLIYVIIIQIKYNKIGYQYEKVISNIISIKDFYYHLLINI